MNFVFDYFNYKIPRSTLQYWKAALKNLGDQKKVGRPIKFPDIDEEIFDLFLEKRSRFFFVSDLILMQMAQGIRKKHLKLLQEEINNKNGSRNSSEVALLKKEKEALVKTKYAQGWVDKFKKRRNIVRRKVTGKVLKDFSYYENKIPKWFEMFNNFREEKGITTLYNFDETAVFMDLNADQVLEIKGKQYVGLSTHSNSKQRCTVILCVNSQKEKLPPCIIFKTTKPRNKTYADHPPSSFPLLGPSVENLVKKKGALVIHSYSGWNSSYIMKNFYIPHLNKYLGNKYKRTKSLFIFDNASCHKTEEVEAAFDKNNIHHYPLPPNSTPFIQPLDSLINKAFKNHLRNKFTQWIDKSFEEICFQAEEEDSGEPLKMKDYFKPPSKDEVIRWILESYDEIKEDLIESSK